MVNQMYLPIQVSRTKVRTAYNKRLEKIANREWDQVPLGSEYNLRYEGIVSAVRNLSVQVELAKMEYGLIFA